MPQVVAIVGSREFVGFAAVRAYVDKLPAGTKVISGGAPGVDTAAIRAAKKRGLPTKEITSEWAVKRGLTPKGTPSHKLAPLVRNSEIARRCTRMVAFWNGFSTGTMHAVKCAILQQKPVRIYPDLGKQWRLGP